MNTNPESRETWAEFVARLGITAKAEPRQKDADDDPKWEAFHYTVTLSRPGATEFPVRFSCGKGWVEKVPFEEIPWAKRRDMARKDWETMPSPGYGSRNLTIHQAEHQATCFRPKPPTAEDVLDSLRMGAQSYDNARDFEDWASDLGFDTDSRKAERAWRETAENTRKLRLFLGDDYNAALAVEAL